jgi:hypothetical protein
MIKVLLCFVAVVGEEEEAEEGKRRKRAAESEGVSS